MKKITVAGILTVVLVVVLSTVAFTASPSDTAEVTVNATVNQAVGLSLSKNSIDLTAGPESSGSDTLTADVKSNWDWKLYVGNIDLTGTDPDGSNVTLQDSELSITTDTGADLDGTGGNLATGTEAETGVVVTYSLGPVPWTVAPAAYSGTHTYTLSYQ